MLLTMAALDLKQTANTGRQRQGAYVSVENGARSELGLSFWGRIVLIGSQGGLSDNCIVSFVCVISVNSVTAWQ